MKNQKKNFTDDWSPNWAFADEVEEELQFDG